MFQICPTCDLHKKRRFLLSVLALAAMLVASLVPAHQATAADDAPVLIGLDAALTGGAGQSGIAIERGILLAMQEINEAGGVLGRPLDLVVRDNRGIPDRGIDHIVELSELPDLVAIVGGIHTPVAMAELPAIHEHEVLYLGPWAAGTPIVDNGYDPNFVFRVSVRDEFAGEFLIDAALERGYERPGLLLWSTGWGRSNEKAMLEALEQRNMSAAGVEWFNTSERSMADQIDALAYAGADVIMLVANPSDGLVVIKDMAARNPAHRLPVISHWGITGGDFYEKGRDAIDLVDLTFLQTYSFFDPPDAGRAMEFFAAYCRRFRTCDSYGDVISPVGTVHAYDLIHLLALAIEKAGTIDRHAVRDALERLDRHEGLVRLYEPPFTATRHDALDITDFRLCRYSTDGSIVPVGLQLQ